MPGTTEVSLTQIVCLALAVAGLTAVMLSTRRRLRSSRRTENLSAREQYARLSEHADARRDVQDAMIELDKLARHIHGQIDTRLARLEGLIRDADQRIAKLSDLNPGRNSGTTQTPDPPHAGAAFDATVGDEEPTDRATPPDAVDDQPDARIYELAEDGIPPPEIADRVGKTTGEIELMLALRRTRQEANALGRS